MIFDSNLPKGIFTASLTPMNEDLSVNHQLLVDHLNWLLQNGSDGICLLGTTGEANSLTVEERLEVIDRVVDSGINLQKILIGTGCCAYPDTVKLTKYAVEKGAGGILMLPPFYYKNLSDAGILDYFKLVIGKVDNPDMRIYLYHFPKMTGVPFTLSLVQKLIKAHPGIIVGLKDSGGDWAHMASFCNEIPGFKVYAGTEKYLLPILQAGGAGCISASTNATGALCGEIYNQWQADTAKELQAYLSKVRTTFERAPFVSGLKYMFSVWKNNPLWLQMRPPNVMPESDILRDLENELRQLEFSIKGIPGTKTT